jgi:hypothetical protein
VGVPRGRVICVGHVGVILWACHMCGPRGCNGWACQMCVSCGHVMCVGVILWACHVGVPRGCATWACHVGVPRWCDVCVSGHGKQENKRDIHSHENCRPLRLFGSYQPDLAGKRVRADLMKKQIVAITCNLVSIIYKTSSSSYTSAQIVSFLFRQMYRLGNATNIVLQ